MLTTARLKWITCLHSRRLCGAAPNPKANGHWLGSYTQLFSDCRQLTRLPGTLEKRGPPGCVFPFCIWWHHQRQGMGKDTLHMLGITFPVTQKYARLSFQCRSGETFPRQAFYCLGYKIPGLTPSEINLHCSRCKIKFLKGLQVVAEPLRSTLGQKMN